MVIVLFHLFTKGGMPMHLKMLISIGTVAVGLASNGGCPGLEFRIGHEDRSAIRTRAEHNGKWRKHGGRDHEWQLREWDALQWPEGPWHVGRPQGDGERHRQDGERKEPAGW